MAFVSEMVDQMRDLLNDASDTQVPFATKKLFLNRGIARLWPDVYRIATQQTTIVSGQVDYTLPVAVFEGMIISVELSTTTAATTYNRFADYDLIPGDEDSAGTLRIGINSVRYADYVIRIRYAAPVPFISAANYAAAQAETWNGPDRAIGLPVLYAMGMCALRKLDDRQDTLRYSTTQALNGVTDQDILASGQDWFAQFEAQLFQMGKPLPPARD